MIRDTPSWCTPLTAYAPAQHGTARLVVKRQRGTFYHEGVGGFEFWRARRAVPIVALQQKDGRRWRTWMVDDPLHWDGMREAVEDVPPGRILVAGLGLGLMLQHMARDPRFTAITVVEQNADVIALIRPTLPVDPRVTLVCADFYDVLETRPEVDGVLWDLAVGNQGQTRNDFVRGMVMTHAWLGPVPLRQFGLRRTPRPLAIS